jgi:hypothetical protein
MPHPSQLPLFHYPVALDTYLGSIYHIFDSKRLSFTHFYFISDADGYIFRPLSLRHREVHLYELIRLSI